MQLKRVEERMSEEYRLMYEEDGTPRRLYKGTPGEEELYEKAPYVSVLLTHDAFIITPQESMNKGNSQSYYVSEIEKLNFAIDCLNQVLNGEITMAEQINALYEEIEKADERLRDAIENRER